MQSATSSLDSGPVRGGRIESSWNVTRSWRNLLGVGSFGPALSTNSNDSSGGSRVLRMLNRVGLRDRVGLALEQSGFSKVSGEHGTVWFALTEGKDIELGLSVS